MPSFDIALILAIVLATVVVALVAWRPGVAVMALGVFLFVQSGVIRAESMPEVVRQVVARIDELTLLVLVIRTLAIGIRRRSLVLPAPLAGTVALVIVGLLSMALNSVAIIAGGTGLYLASKAGLWLFVAANLRYDERTLVRYLMLIGSLFVLAALIAVLQFAGVTLPWEPYVRRSGELAAPSIWSQHTIFGSSMAVAVGLAVVAFRLPGGRVHGFVLLAASSVGILLSSVRRLLISLPVAAALTLGMLPRARRAAATYLRRRDVQVVLGVVVVGVVVVAAPRLLRIVIDTWDEYVVHAADRDRYVLYRGAWKLAMESAPFGRGPGTFGSFASVLFNSPAYAELGISLPDTLKMGAPYATILGEYGLVGLVAFGAFIVLTLRLTISVARSGGTVLAVALATGGLLMVTSMTLESVVHQVFSDSFVSFFVFAGIGASVALQRRQSDAADAVQIAAILRDGRTYGGSLAASLVIVAALVAGVAAAQQRAVGVDHRPNIVLVMVDNLDVDTFRALAELDRSDGAPAASIEQLIGGAGATFQNSFAVDSAACCTSMVSLLRGQYPHNHGIWTDQPGEAYAAFQQGLESSALSGWLQAAGYRTGLIGQYVDGYGSDVLPPSGDPARQIGVPPGWNTESWRAIYGTPSYLGYHINSQGVLSGRGSTERAYQTDVVAQMSVAVARQSRDRPFFLLVTPSALRNAVAADSLGVPRDPVSGQPLAAERHASLYPDVNPPAGVGPTATDLYRTRLQTMAAVEELVSRLIDSLGSQAANTYLIFTSANGYHLGGGLDLPGSGTPFESDVRVPLVVSGPGIAAGLNVPNMVTNLDITATILDMADADAAIPLDGHSFLPLLGGTPDPAWRDAISLESRAGPQDPADGWTALRTAGYMYVERADGAVELYDLVADPGELDNVAAGNPNLVAEFAARMHLLESCAGPSCFAFQGGR